ncbi:enoyl-CoA hydratase/isomerase family protein [Paraburkholderia xenovorans LB400]|uniref:Enoyl-CoA hydratase n=1 Tax=Paraburkholderia xenovorans (strain LB400) TaxID=266265 RepID=Q13HM3_PARXL|nr:enoyl-CoA hydratase-related protein [Paraburkholderia xenovorans]ABE36416.1 Enoyl-CoA hydratase [Paraburkholderia xenovorans LB400]AIP35020.1 enoyl-CoA hydratase/isomerase family protein [Paraburkholderia xenovorans LB400]
MKSNKQYSSLGISESNGVLRCVLAPGHRLNLIDAATHEELEEFFADLVHREDVRVVVLTGAGNVFSSGGDLRSVANDEYHKGLPGGATTRAGLRMIRNLVSVPQPVIAALNGDCCGLAASIALHCDIIVAHERARIGDPHVSVGAVAGDGGAVVWPLQVSLSRAKEYLMLGELIPAREAERIGLINHVYDDATYDAAVERLATRLASGAMYAIRWTKAAINKVLIERVNMVLDTSLALEGLSFTTQDYKEGMSAFLEKRQPMFKGR